jgi:hypothetical protein
MQSILAHVTGAESGVLAACLLLGIVLGIGFGRRILRPGPRGEASRHGSDER